MNRLQGITLGPDPHANFSAIAKALVEPLMKIREMEGGPDFGRLLAREIHDPVEGGRGIVEEYFDPIARLVIDLLQRAAPGASFARVCWAYHFATGALAVNHTNTGRIERLSNGQCRAANVDELIEELTVFITAGLVGALGGGR
jgi:Tetracyclin repressor-like, C-terminal domain